MLVPMDDAAHKGAVSDLLLKLRAQRAGGAEGFHHRRPRIFRDLHPIALPTI
jgi:hypothetical protein